MPSVLRALTPAPASKSSFTTSSRPAAAADELVCAGGGGLERLGGVNDEAALV
ncbi:MAG: hypothetical protein PUD60_05735 [Akkermansia muciniphila]|nr:hypothetical protein [Akkermansia muciniphila]